MRKVNEIVSAGIAEKLSLTGGDGFHMHPPADETRNGFMTVEDRILLNRRTSSAVPNTLMQRDSQGQSKVGVPSDSDHIARKGDVDQLKTRVDQIIADGDSSAEVVDARGIYPLLGGRLNAVDAQLADVKQLMIASWHGVDSSIGSADATDMLNSLFAAAKASGKRYVYFDEPHTYNVSGDLVNARDLILIGCGARIMSNNLKNYFIQIADGSTYNGKYNLYPESDLLFRTASIALQNRVVNVTLWGDSTLTGGSDITGIKYGVDHKGASEQSPNGLTAGDSFYQRLVDSLIAKFPDVTFNFYNRAIGGALIQNSEDNQTFNGVTKPWPEHIKDTNPDVLVIGFGMNTNYAYSKTFRYYMDRISDFIKLKYTKKPSLCWMTTPRPVMALDGDFGSAESQISRHLAAYSARYSGILKGGYIIDVNRASDIVRTGIDYARPIMKTKELSGLISGTYSESGGIFTMDADGEYLDLDAAESDFVLEFEINFGTVQGGNMWFSYNNVNSMESALLIFPNYSGNGLLQNYANFLDFDHYSITASYTDSVPWNDSAWRSIRVEKRSEVLNVFINGVRCLRDIVAINNLPGKISMRMNGTGSAVYQVRNIKLYGGSYKQYIPRLTEEEMWGQHVNGDYNTKTPYGGNGANHPSTIGLESVYMPALREFIDDLALLSNQSLISLRVLPKQVAISSWQTAPITTTASGANLRYQNIEKTEILRAASLTGSDGTRLKLRSDVRRYEDAVNLLDGEFAYYESNGATQVFIAYSGSLASSYTFTGYFGITE